MHYLYRIKNILNDKVYIGQSNKETERWRQHKYFARQTQPVQYIHQAMKKYGAEHFVYEVIACCLTQEDADITEIQLIMQYDSRNKEKGYNIAPGGEGAWNTGLPRERQPMYGKKQSEFFKKRMSEVHKGKIVIHTTESKSKISQSLMGHPVNESSRLKSSLSQKGKPKSEETRKRMSESALKRKRG
jgi:group I intron endonuclease